VVEKGLWDWWRRSISGCENLYFDNSRVYRGEGSIREVEGVVVGLDLIHSELGTEVLHVLRDVLPIAEAESCHNKSNYLSRQSSNNTSWYTVHAGSNRG